MVHCKPIVFSLNAKGNRIGPLKYLKTSALFGYNDCLFIYDDWDQRQ